MSKKQSIKKSLKKSEPTFSITLKLGDKVYSSNGSTALDALVSLPKPSKLMGKGFLTITQGKLKKEELYYPIRLKRLFYNKIYQIIQAKNLLVGMK